MPTTNKNILSQNEFAALVGTSVRNLRYHIKKNRIQTTTREVLGIPKSEVKAWRKLQADINRRKSEREKARLKTA